MILTDRDSILKAEDLKTTTIEIPEWNGEIKLRELRADEREKFEREMMGIRNADGSIKGSEMAKQLGTFRAKLLVACIVNEQNDSIFTEKDIPHLNKKSATVVDRLFKECLKLSGLTKEGLDEKLGESDTTNESVS